jgi:predicted RNase H-like nuclease
VVVEAYPAAALRRWGLAWRGYKRKEQDEARRTLVERLLAETASWLYIGQADVGRCLQSDDTFDALVAALVARAAAVGLVDPIPDEDKRHAQREGWIAVPEPGSLGFLPIDRAPYA